MVRPRRSQASRSSASQAAADLLGTDQPKVSALLRGRLEGFSSDRPFRFLNVSRLVLLALAALLAPFRPAADLERPPIAFFLSDDHAAQAIGCYGGTLMKTPNLDRLAAAGMRLDQPDREKVVSRLKSELATLRRELGDQGE